MAEVQAETTKDLTTSKGDAGLVDIWSKEIENASKKEKSFRVEARDYSEVYKNEITKGGNRNQTNPEGYNIFWSNTQTLRPLVFSNLPNPNITRRFLDKDDNSRILSEMMERSLSFFLEESNSYDDFIKARDDYLVPGRGLVRVVFDPEEVVEIKEEFIDDDSGESVIEVTEELDPSTKKVRTEYVGWEDFRMSTETTWKDKRWVAFRHKMSREQLVDQFGSKGEKVDLNYNTLEHLEESDRSNDDIFKQAEVWEIWDKVSGKVMFMTLGGSGSLLSDEEDNYNLKDFFPIAKPLGTDSNIDDTTPIPLYRMYKAQASELNRIDARIRNLVEQIKFSGVYSSVAEGTNIESIMNGEDGAIAPLAGIQPGTKIGDMIEFKPIIDLANVVVSLRTQKAEIIQNIRDITGLSDIVRGTTTASETATAQRLKGDFAISRIQPLQKEFELFVRNTDRLEIELIVENYSAEELATITNLEIIDINLIAQNAQAKQEALIEEATQLINPQDPQAQEKLAQLKEQAEAGFKATMDPFIKKLKGYAVTPEQLDQIDALMKDDKLRTFAVDVETDSTVRVDQNQEKADRVEYIQAISTFTSSMFPVLQAGIINKNTFNEFLSFISKPFKVGRNLEEHLLSEEEEEPKGPSMEEQLAQAENQRADQRLQLDAQKQQVDADQNQQKINIDKAKVKVDIEQHQDDIEFKDVNMEADRRAKTSDAIIQDATNRVTSEIRESNLI